VKVVELKSLYLSHKWLEESHQWQRPIIVYTMNRWSTEISYYTAGHELTNTGTSYQPMRQ